jgi:hypothetical protein
MITGVTFCIANYLNVNQSTWIGTTVLVGAPQLNFSTGKPTGPGKAYIFVKPVGGWKTTPKFDSELTATDEKKGRFARMIVCYYRQQGRSRCVCWQWWHGSSVCLHQADKWLDDYVEVRREADPI